MHAETRRRLLQASAAAIALAAIPGHAQTAFPSRPIRIVVPYAPGGGVDFVGRLLAQKLTEVLGQPLVVENRGGAGSMIGSAAVANADPDGYTILLNGTTLAMQPSLVKNLSYNVANDFKPVGLIVSYGLTLIVSSQVPVQSLQDFVEYARQPGQKIFYGSPGVGTTPHLAAELFNSVAGVKMTHVPYRGNGPLMAGLLAGDVQAGFDTVQNSKPLAEAGSIRILALSGKSRSSSAPEIPTAVEAGLAGFELDMWQGLFLPKGVPEEVVAVWSSALQKVLSDPAVVSRFGDAGFSVSASSPEQLGTLVSTELARWKEVVRTAGIQAE
jgi:tripartite-type tricarboxylate transporter receptor subunit TctC